MGKLLFDGYQALMLRIPFHKPLVLGTELALIARVLDERPATLNLDGKLIEQAITPQTRAIMAVRYAGVACQIGCIKDIAARHDLYVIEDAAQGVNAFYKDCALGTVGDLGGYNFHDTKNVTCGESGAP